MPRRFVMRRSPGLYVVVLVELLVLHFVLCYPVAIERGYPPPHPFWLVSIYLAFLGVGILPLFDDFSYMPMTRSWFLRTFIILSSIIFGVAMTNRHDARPSLGHLVGYLVLIQERTLFIIGESIVPFLFISFFVYCWESVWRGIWDRVRTFANEAPKAPTVWDLILFVGSVGVTCGLIRLIIAVDPWPFSRPFIRDW